MTDPKVLAMHAVEAAFVKNALNPILLDVAGLASYTDYILILSGRSARQVESIAEAVASGMKSCGHDPLGKEGADGGQWMLLDYGDVIVHVFYHPIRERYDIEGLWVEAPRVELDVPPELRTAHIYG